MFFSSKCSPKFFKYAYTAGACTKISSALAVSTNTLLVALGANPFQIGIANGVKLIGQIFSQFFGLHFINQFNSRRKTLMWALVIETVVKLGFVVLAFLRPTYWFEVFLVIIFGVGVLSYTTFLAYYTWMSEIIPRELKDRFFANRSLTGEVTLIIGLLIVSWVLNLPQPILLLLGSLYLAAYFTRNLEILTYLFHPEAKRVKLLKNHVGHRMWSALQDKHFVHFISWYNLVNTASVLNVLFLEFFIVHVLQLAFFWIPLSLVLISCGSILGYRIFENVFPKISQAHKLRLVTLLLLLSSLSWVLTSSPTLLAIALLIDGVAEGAIKLTQRVETIQCSEGKDKEGYYAAFNTMEYVLSGLAVFGMSFLQKSVFSFHLIFAITIPMALLSLLFVREGKKA